MKTVKAARIHSYGGQDVVCIEQVALPDPGSGELLVRVHAAGVNPIDWRIRAGQLKRTMPLSLPVTLGGDFSGVVEQVGAGVSGFRVGDEIYGQAPVFRGGSGSFAESLIARAGNVAIKPRFWSHTLASALPLAGVSAWQALTEHLRIAPGERILIHGGAGGVGSIAVQLARHLGAQVLTTVGAHDAAYVRSLGIEGIIDYNKQRFEDAVRDVDAVLDTIGGEICTRSYQVLKKRGRLVSLLEAPRAELVKEFGVEASMQYTQVTTERLSLLTTLVERGALKVHINETLTLDAASLALLHLEKAPLRGKVVLKMLS